MTSKTCLVLKSVGCLGHVQDTIDLESNILGLIIVLIVVFLPPRQKIDEMDKEIKKLTSKNENMKKLNKVSI